MDKNLIEIEDTKQADSIKKKILISLEKHHSKGIVIHGHQECAGNPVEDKQHVKDTLKTAEFIKSLIPEKIKIVSAFVKRDSPASSGWTVEELT